ncbi:MAG: YkgJ family cysteine cluster protein [Planctomycetales bacterium]
MNDDEHQLDDQGEHWEHECEVCLERNESICCECRCGRCCEAMLIEASLRDAEREPRLQECSPIYDDNPDENSRELIGYMLNDKENEFACRFFDRHTRLCTIYDTRPLICRLFNCDTERKKLWPDDE